MQSSRLIALAAVLALPLWGASGAALADVVLNTSLPSVSGPFGAATATTATGPTGTVTTVNGPGGSANRAISPVVPGAWSQQNIGGNASVGITTTYARSGNGSASFAGSSGNSKGDLEIYFGSGYALSSLSALSYDWYRNGASAVGADLHPVIRLILAPNSYLIYEGAYNEYTLPATTAPTNVWVSANVLDAFFWANSGALDAVNPGYKYDFTLDDWTAAVDGLTVIGLSIGFGSGWNGAFDGAVDNVRVAFGNDFDKSWNFEVATVPTPATLPLLLLGLIGLSVAHRRKTRA